jgi:hypothetical protein
MAYDKLFETIKKNKLTNQSRVDKAIFQDMTLSEVICLTEDLYTSIEAESSPPKVLGLQDYHFLANSRMSGIFGRACNTRRCRSQRVDRLSRFATLYSDAVYIQSYFSDFKHYHIDPKDPFSEHNLRNSISGSIQIVNQIEPLLRNGIVRFVPTAILLCPNCNAKLIEQLDSFDANLSKQMNKLHELYSQTTSANLEILPTPSADGHKYEVHITCDQDLDEHGGGILTTSKLSPILLKKAASNPSLKQYQLSSSEILRGHVIKGLLQGIATDVTCLKFYCSNSNLKYLTDRKLDVSILQATTEEHNFLKYNDVLSSQLMFEMPIFSNISLSTLLKIRANEYDAFTSYRETINHLVNEYVAQGRELSPKIAKQIYSDIIQPKVSRLDKRISSIRASAILRSTATVALSTSSLIFGLYGNYLPPAFQAALISLGLTSAVGTAKSLPNIIGTPAEIRNDNLYFLWKLSKMSKVI